MQGQIGAIYGTLSGAKSRIRAPPSHYTHKYVYL